MEEIENCAARMCPVCGEDSIVYDSREQWDGSIRRRRKCVVCGTRFLTVEKFEKLLEALDIDRRNGGPGVPLS